MFIWVRVNYLELSTALLRLPINFEDVPRSAYIKLQAVYVFGFTILSADILFSIYQLKPFSFTFKIYHSSVPPRITHTLGCADGAALHSAS